MTLYCRVTLATLSALQPENLPAELAGWDDVSLSDIGAVVVPCPPKFEGCGFWPADLIVPDIDEREQALTDSYELVVDADAKRVVAEQKPRDLTDEEKETLPRIDYRVLGKGEFYDLVRASGVSFDSIKAAKDAPQMEEFWFALENFYTQIQRDHANTRAGIGGMVALGFVTQDQSDEIFASWPKQ